MKSEDFSYILPEELIAQTPLADRSSSRLMHLNRKGGAFSHHCFTDLLSFLEPGDLLVFNDTKVLPARLIGERKSGGKAEVLLLRELENNRWECLVKPGKKLRPGTEVFFGENFKGVIEETTSFGGRIVHFIYQGIWLELLEKYGQMPLPPYIHETLKENERYQTVYAEHLGSAAAPTAGLHFTPELLKTLQNKGVETAFLTLHVGLGTFRPVQVENVLDHHMHSEYFHFPASCGEKIKKAKANQKRVIAVGTTSVRVLETVAQKGEFSEQEGWTEIFIYPGYDFRWVDGLVTNFHLPQSTLMMLVSALAGQKQICEAYEEAVQKKYRFFSFGDSMLIL